MTNGDWPIVFTREWAMQVLEHARDYCRRQASITGMGSLDYIHAAGHCDRLWRVLWRGWNW